MSSCLSTQEDDSLPLRSQIILQSRNQYYYLLQWHVWRWRHTAETVPLRWRGWHKHMCVCVCVFMTTLQLNNGKTNLRHNITRVHNRGILHICHDTHLWNGHQWHNQTPAVTSPNRRMCSGHGKDPLVEKSNIRSGYVKNVISFDSVDLSYMAFASHTHRYRATYLVTTPLSGTNTK